MPHQCTKCGEIYPDASGELLSGCKCGSKFFYYIKQERLDEIEEERENEVKQVMDELEKSDKEQIEKDIREITGMSKEPEKPIILDLESVKVIKPGKFEIDIVNLLNKRRPLIYKLEEGKYIIDLASSLKVNKEEVAKKIRDPRLFMKDDKNIRKIEKKKTIEKGLDEEIEEGLDIKDEDDEDKLDIENEIKENENLESEKEIKNNKDAGQRAEVKEIKKGENIEKDKEERFEEETEEENIRKKNDNEKRKLNGDNEGETKEEIKENNEEAEEEGKIELE